MQNKFSINQISKIYSRWFKKLQLNGKDYNELLLILIRASGRYLGFYEEWKDVSGYEGLYQISNFGRVKSLERIICRNKQGQLKINESILQPYIDKHGYFHVCLYKYRSKKTIKIHQIVAIAFLNHIRCNFKLVINHKSTNKLDNNINNLEIVTMRENSNLKHIKHSSNYTGVSWNKALNKWSSKIWLNNKSKHLGYFDNEFDAHIAYEIEINKIYL